MPKHRAASSNYASIDDALAELQAGRCIVVADDENRENEGDLICGAQHITPDLMNFFLNEARGCICLSLTQDRTEQLELTPMVKENDSLLGTAFTVTIDADTRFGVTTGVSASDRATTIRVAIDPDCKPGDLRRPGHTFPLIAEPGGVLQRPGHTEAAIDLVKLAGLYPAAVLCEILNKDGSMARFLDLKEFCKLHNFKLISIAQLIEYRGQLEQSKQQSYAATSGY